MIRRKTRSSVASIAGAVLSLLLLAPAIAAGTSTSATVTGGTLSISTPLAGEFAATTVSGATQTTAASLDPFTVSDLTGSGAGWRITAQAAPFAGSDRALAAGSLTMSQPTATAIRTKSPAPAIVAGPYAIDVESPFTIASAGRDEGMGNYEFGATTLTLRLPTDVYAGTYISVMTISVISGP
jgi:hypothetical protein